MQEQLKRLEIHSSGLLGCWMASLFIQNMCGALLMLGFSAAIILVGFKKKSLKQKMEINE